MLAILAAGVALGRVFSDFSLLAVINRYLTRLSLWALLGVMGAKLAEQRSLFSDNLNAFFAAIASSLALTLVFFFVFWVAVFFRKKSVKRELIAKPPALPGTRTPDPHFSATATLVFDVSRGFAITSHIKDNGTSKKPEACSAINDKPIGAVKELLSVAINGGFIIIGFALFLFLPESRALNLPTDALITWLLWALLFFIGLDLGLELRRLDLRRLAPALLLTPFLNIAVSLATGLLFGLLTGLGARNGALLTAGMGWYSLSAALLAENGMMALSILSFIHNVFRELLAILCAPLAARLSPLLPIYLGGATSMDVTLPFVQRYCGKEYTLVSFYSGVICSGAVLPVVKIIIS